MKKILLIFTLLIFVLYSCKYNNEEELYPSAEGCDTTDMSFNDDIKPILSAHCFSCHDNSNASTIGAGIAIEDYGDVKKRADNGSLLGAIKHTSGYSRMPLGSSKIDVCKIVKIEAWVNDGAKIN